MKADPAIGRTVRVKVWDAAVRLFHWSLVAAFALAYVSRHEHYDLHLASGYTVLGLIAFRVGWGFLGPVSARFSSFVVGPTGQLAYLRGIARRQPARFLGHNPPGGLMVVALLAVLLIVAASGVALDAAENRAGPLAGYTLFLYTDRIDAIHDLSTDLALALVFVHVVGVVLSSRLHHENLVVAMITGYKRADADDSGDVTS